MSFSNVEYKLNRITLEVIIMKTKYFINHLQCDNDNNGNPRRIYQVIDLKDGIVDYYDEGAYGLSAIDNYDRNTHDTKGVFQITPKEYRRLYKLTD